MKKCLSLFTVLGLFGLYLAPFSSNAQGSTTRGSSYTERPNQNCPTGMSNRCWGTGDVCDLTIGFDCGVQSPKER